MSAAFWVFVIVGGACLWVAIGRSREGKLNGLTFVQATLGLALVAAAAIEIGKSV